MKSHTTLSIGGAVTLAMTLAFFSCHQGSTPLPTQWSNLPRLAPVVPSVAPLVEAITPTPRLIEVRHFTVHNGAMILKDGEGRRYLVDVGVLVPPVASREPFSIDASRLIPIPDELPLELIQYDSVKNQSVIKLLETPREVK